MLGAALPCLSTGDLQGWELASTAAMIVCSLHLSGVREPGRLLTALSVNAATSELVKLGLQEEFVAEKRPEPKRAMTAQDKNRNKRMLGALMGHLHKAECASARPHPRGHKNCVCWCVERRPARRWCGAWRAAGWARGWLRVQEAGAQL
jgi:hypothetical protein